MLKYLVRSILLFLTLAVIIYGQGCADPSSGSGASLKSSQSPPPNLATKRCAPAAGISGAPTTIVDAVALINSLPKPVTVDCVIESLDRPLYIYATQSVSSAQPADGQRSPRVFVFSGNLLISIVLDGDAKNNIEFGQLRSSTESIKGDLLFPLNDVIAPGLPFERVKNAANTNCAFCHGAGALVPEITVSQAYSSRAIAPMSATKVDLAYLRNQASSCDAAAEPDRCKLLNSIFNWGTVLNKEFPADMPR